MHRKCNMLLKTRDTGWQDSIPPAQTIQEFAEFPMHREPFLNQFGMGREGGEADPVPSFLGQSAKGSNTMIRPSCILAFNRSISGVCDSASAPSFPTYLNAQMRQWTPYRSEIAFAFAQSLILCFQLDPEDHPLNLWDIVELGPVIYCGKREALLSDYGASYLFDELRCIVI